jgi:hypothetical protein
MRRINLSKGNAMDDRELLELAAKAAGHNWRKDIAEYRDDKGILGLWLINDDGTPLHTGWNPLDNDGDALRLAVKLQMTVDVLPWGVTAKKWNDVNTDHDAERHNSDPFAATRRAIVRAAAEIGKDAL